MEQIVMYDDEPNDEPIQNKCLHGVGNITCKMAYTNEIMWCIQ